MNPLAGAAAVITICSFLLALWQFLDARRTRQSERERIAGQSERLQTAVAAAIGGAETADLIVQRARAGATVTELRTIAKTMRVHMELLARQLEREHSLLEDWEPGRMTRSSRPRIWRTGNDGDTGSATTTPDSA
ncbi:hypothetical protein [Actinocorallia libanotica]|uniref:Uncharacterized protein n=1 Tax=Actinocorallia libanotica TaxID=46162 RepID=A0ABN1RYG8_9ACTN